MLLHLHDLALIELLLHAVVLLQAQFLWLDLSYQLLLGSLLLLLVLLRLVLQLVRLPICSVLLLELVVDVVGYL